MSNVFIRRIPTVFRDSAWIAVTDYISYGSMFAFSVVLGQVSGLKELSYFTVAFALTSVILGSISSSFTSIFKRELSVNFARKDILLGAFVASRVTVILVVLSVLGIYALVSNRSESKFHVVILLVFAARALDSLSDLILSMFQVKGMMFEFAILKAGNQIVTLLLMAGIMLTYRETTTAYVASLLTSVGFVIWGWLLARFRFGMSLTFDFPYLKTSVVESFPLLIAGLVGALSQRMNVFIVTARLGLDAGGVMGTLINVVAGVSVIASAFGTVLFIRFSRTFANNPQQLHVDVKKFTAFLGVLGLGFAFTLWMLAPAIVNLYVSLPENATITLRILAFGLIPIFMQSAVGYLFVVTRRQRDGFIFSLFSLVLGGVMYYLGVSFFGIAGAAFAYIAYGIFWVIGAYIWTKKYLQVGLHAQSVPN
jgi:O-antigen/teichoic acid export membrane protein